MSAAKKMIRMLPTRALTIPPPVSPTGFGTLTRKCQLILVIPCLDDKAKDKEKGNDTGKSKDRYKSLEAVVFTNPVFDTADFHMRVVNRW